MVEKLSLTMYINEGMEGLPIRERTISHSGIHSLLENKSGDLEKKIERERRER